MTFPSCCDDAETPPPFCCPAAVCARFGHTWESRNHQDESCRVCDLPSNHPRRAS